MAETPAVGPLVLSYEARRGGVALPLSLTAHALALGALLLIPQAARPALPEVPAFVHEALVLPVARATPPPAAILVTPVARPAGPRAPAPMAMADAAPALPEGPGHIALPLDPAPLAELGDAPACVGCAIGGPPSVPSGGAGAGSDGSGATAAGTAPLPVGGVIRAPLKLRNVDPAYPPLARQAGVQGTVAIECVIDAEGNVVQVRAVEGSPLLTRAALDAVGQWRYRPTLLDGTPVAVRMTVRVQFHLH